MGDLKVLASPVANATQLGGAEKGGTVTVLNWDASPEYAQIAWAGGSRWPAATGFAKKQYLVRSGHSAPTPPNPSPVPLPVSVQTAIVKTNDPPPMGDLIVRALPDPNSPQIGGAEKDGRVTVLVANAGNGMSHIAWAGGSRWPAVTGFVKTQFLVMQAPSVASGRLSLASGNVVIGAAGKVKLARCAAPSGCRLRHSPEPTASHSTIVPHGGAVRILRMIPGAKAEAQSPGPGGWTEVEHGAMRGWMPSEWLVQG
jgi:hypothetical protein